jgi:hypothetical protein
VIFTSQRGGPLLVTEVASPFEIHVSSSAEDFVPLIAFPGSPLAIFEQIFDPGKGIRYVFKMMDIKRRLMTAPRANKSRDK